MLKKKILGNFLFSLFMVFLLMSTYGCYKIPRIEEVGASSVPVETKAIVTSTPTLVPIVKLEEGTYSATFQGEKVLKDVQVTICSLPCDGKNIEEQLQFNPETWKAVVDGDVIYIHSGRFTNSLKDYEFGEIFRESYINDTIIGSIICFKESLCYSIDEYMVPNTQEERISSSEIFSQQRVNDYFLVTCENPTDDNSPKLIMLLRLIE